MMREGLRTLLLNQADMEIVGEAEDGESVVRLARELAPDVVLMDVEMPGFNGIHAARQILAVQETVRIVALSIHAETQFVTGMLAAGACAYLLKDCAFDELIQAIRGAMAGKIVLSPEIRNNALEDYRRGVNTPPLLSPRQEEVLRLLAKGMTAREIAAHLGIHAKTVEMHRQHVMKKVGTRSLVRLIKYAIREGLSSLNP
ncbi:MAG: response regulator transcription factor [Lentisphaerae bacterium]|nr:response regulator transcription factor [Lentisphaerota bacterium]